MSQLPQQVASNPRAAGRISGEPAASEGHSGHSAAFNAEQAKSRSILMIARPEQITGFSSLTSPATWNPVVWVGFGNAPATLALLRL